MIKNRNKWIEEGYFIFAYKGPNEIKIERLSKTIEINKSSFYHFFATKELFKEELLNYHLNCMIIMGQKFEEATKLEDLISIFIKHKTDLLFNRQLRIHRQKPIFQKCLLKTNEISSSSILNVWKSILELENNSYLARLVLRLSVENFFLQITEEHLNQKWLNNYFTQLKEMVSAFKNNITH